jgi:hypothetical protein
MSFIDVVDGSRMGVTQAIVSAHSSAELDELAAKYAKGGHALTCPDLASFCVSFDADVALSESPPAPR